MFVRYEKQPSSTTFIAKLNEEKFKKLIEEEMIRDILGLYRDSEGRLSCHISDPLSSEHMEAFYKYILPNWEVIEELDYCAFPVVKEAGAEEEDIDSKPGSVGMLVITIDNECSYCPWCYAKVFPKSNTFNEVLYREIDKEFMEKLESLILRLSENVRYLSVIVGGSVDPLDYSYVVVDVRDVVKSLSKYDSNIFLGLSTSKWFYYYTEKILEWVIIDDADIVALTFLDEELRDYHNELRKVSMREYYLTLRDIISELAPKVPDLVLTFISPYIPEPYVFKDLVLYELPFKYVRDLKYLLLHPHNWFDKKVYSRIEDNWDQIIDYIFELMPERDRHNLLLDVCLVKKFTKIDLCSSFHWRFHLPSMQFEVVKPCPRGGVCYWR